MSTAEEGLPAAPAPLRIFFFTDWRVAPLELAEAMLEAAGPVDLILYGGDDVARFAPIDMPEGIPYCGFPSDADDTLDGFTVGLLYERFRRWGDPLPLRLIRRRNANDVRRLALIGQWLRNQNQSLEQDQRVEAAVNVASADEWGRRFAEGVLRAYLGGRGHHRWAQACVRGSGVPPAQVKRMMEQLQPDAPAHRWRELSHHLFG